MFWLRPLARPAHQISILHGTWDLGEKVKTEEARNQNSPHVYIPVFVLLCFKEVGEGNYCRMCVCVCICEKPKEAEETAVAWKNYD